jgi:hypothetical protein
MLLMNRADHMCKYIRKWNEIENENQSKERKRQRNIERGGRKRE